MQPPQSDYKTDGSLHIYGSLVKVKFCESTVCLRAVVVTDPSQPLLDEVQLLSGVYGQQVGSHHLTGQRDGVPGKGLLRQQVLSSTVKHPGLTLCG